MKQRIFQRPTATHRATFMVESEAARRKRTNRPTLATHPLRVGREPSRAVERWGARP